MAGKVFINYRRAANLKDAQLLHGVLARQFGRAGVFLDVSGLDGGDHWLHTLEKQVDASAAMVALIGRGWVDVLDEKGQRRLDNPNDFVRFEIARAFARNIPVLPVLIDGAPMPEMARLPPNLLPLTFPQAMLLRAESVDDDGDKIARRLKHLIAAGRPRGISLVRAGALAVAALAAGVAAGPSLWSLAGLLPSEPPDMGRLRTEARKAEGEAREAGARAGRAEAARKEAETKLAEAGRDVETLATEREKAVGEAREARAALAKAEQPVRTLTAEAAKQADLAKRAADERAAEAKKREAAEKALSESQTEAQRLAALVKRGGEERAAEQAKRETAERSLESALAKSREGSDPSPRPSQVSSVAAREGSDPKMQSGQTFRDCPACPEMVVVPAGSFTMGSNDGDDDEKTPHAVTIPKPFAVGKYEVTFAEWDACVAAGACKHKPGDQGWGRDRRPVINVSWDDVTKEYLPWLSRQSNKTYRRLSEAEWEYAARAGGMGKWSFGDAEDELGQHAWYTANAGRKTQSVGGKKANAFGMHDMQGNVWEWVEDCWNDSYAAKPLALKSSGAAWTIGDCKSRVLRGGSWYNNSTSLRSADRHRSTPGNRYDYVGFRVGRTLTP